MLQAHAGREGMSIRQALARISSEGGWRAYFRGNGTNCIKISPETAIKVRARALAFSHRRARLETSLRFFGPDPPRVGGWVGVSAGVRPLSLSCPARSLARLLADSPAPHPPTHPHTHTHTIRSATIPRDTQLSMNDRMKLWLYGRTHDISPSQRMVSGGLSGAAAQAAIYPLEIVRTRLAVSPVGTYTGITHCLAKVYRAEGIRAWYRGMGTAMVGIVPYAGIDIACFEMLKAAAAEKHGAHPPAHILLLSGMTSSCFAQVGIPARARAHAPADTGPRRRARSLQGHGGRLSGHPARGGPA